MRTMMTMIPALILITACGTIGTVSSEDLLIPIEAVGMDLETYIATDASLTPTDRVSMMAPYQRLRIALNATDRVSPTALATDVNEMASIFERYVNADTSISQKQRSWYLQTSSQLREIVSPPK